MGLALSTLLGACGSSSTARRYDDVLSNGTRDFKIDAGPEVLGTCGLDASRSYFAYNSSELSEEDKVQLAEVGRCLTSGRLRGRSILVTGYTDSSGDRPDNYELGFARSTAVATELSTRGVPQTRIFLRSRGEGRAEGDTDEGRALDRKVDLRAVTLD
jgi:outer membrane protein OmpA-like peptidoglycan-associated protein